MSGSNRDLHGSAPDNSPVALLLIDVINDLDFPGSEQLLPQARAMAESLHALCEQARRHKVPLIYVNDNFGRWRADFNTLVEHCLHDGVPGEQLVSRLKPQEDDYFVLKPKHSGFYSTGLDLLLGALGAKTVVITGLATNICVLFTANDAYMRNLQVVVPRDCCAANKPAEHESALELMQTVLKADVRPGAELDWSKLTADK